MLQFDENNPRTVSRGLEIQPVFLGLDSLYLVVEYPNIDVYRYWSSFVPNGFDKRLFDGIPQDNVLIRRGALGYKLSVWHGDARLFLTDRVEDSLVKTNEQGQGMGLMLQLGAKWLCQNADLSSQEALSGAIFELLRLFKVPQPELYPMRLNRIDIALDVIGINISDFSMDEWQHGWVGRASVHGFYIDSTTRTLSGFDIGTSQGAVRFKAYDKVLQSIKDKDSFFWFSVWDLTSMPKSGITRFEWSIKPHNAQFVGMQYLSEYSFDGLRELINYVTEKWGRLCIVQQTEKRTRWETHPLWVRIRRIMVEEWDIDHVGMAKREYHISPDLNPEYLNSVTGWLAGLMARIAIEKGYDQPADVIEALVLAEKQSKPVEIKAREKLSILSKLATVADSLKGYANDSEI